MNFTNFPNHPLNVSKLCLGTMMFGDKCDYSQSEAIIKKAFELGINSFDTATMYANGTCFVSR